MSMSTNGEAMNNNCTNDLEVNVRTISKKQADATIKILIDNGIDGDEASTVLQAIGYALLDRELEPILDLDNE